MANLKNKKNVTKATTASVQTEKAVETKTEAPKKEEAAAVKAAEPKQPAKETESKAADAKAVEKKAPVKRAAKKPVKKVETVEEVFVEYANEQILTEGLVNRIKEQYKNEGHRVGAIKSLRVYINLEHRRAYYVINDKHEENKFIEF